MYFALDHLLLVKLLGGVAVLLAASGALAGTVMNDDKAAKTLFIDACGFMGIMFVAIVLHRLQ